MKLDEEGEFSRCPYCKGTFDERGYEHGGLIVVEDWSSMHNKETLLHCYDCDRKYIVYYKLEKIVELREEEIEFDLEA